MQVHENQSICPKSWNALFHSYLSSLSILIYICLSVRDSGTWSQFRLESGERRSIAELTQKRTSIHPRIHSEYVSFMRNALMVKFKKVSHCCSVATSLHHRLRHHRLPQDRPQHVYRNYSNFRLSHWQKIITNVTLLCCSYWHVTP